MTSEPFQKLAKAVLSNTDEYLAEVGRFLQFSLYVLIMHVSQPTKVLFLEEY